MDQLAKSPFASALRSAAMVFAVAVIFAVVAAINMLAAALFAVAAAIMLGRIYQLQQRVDGAARRLAAIRWDPSVPLNLENGVASMEQQMAALHNRRLPTHPVSGLPMREALLTQMNTDGHGILGALDFADFDRLTAFDPALGERVFAASTMRLRAMLSHELFIAQVDRGHVGLWFGRDTDEANARAQLDAIAYALGDEIEDGDTKIAPQIRVRIARYDQAEGIDATAFLSRILATFALSGNALTTINQPVTDFAEAERNNYVLEQDLRQAMARREFRLDFQPLIDAATGCVSGAEALIRWDHPTRGPISPAQFVPIAETIGMAGEIGMWSLNAALRAAQDWKSQGLSHLRVAVNVSALQLERDDLPVQIQRTLQRHELDAAALEIELTESVATSDAKHCRHIFQELRAMGIKLAVDDFGTGYSGFSSLRELAFDKIKIDRAFVTDVDTQTDNQAICQSIVALGRGLGIGVLAEGVERREEYEWLRRNGCHHFQGYYFARPMSSEAFIAFVRDHGRISELLQRHVAPA